MMQENAKDRWPYRLLGYIRSKGEVSCLEMRRDFNLSRAHLGNILRDLASQGLVYRYVRGVYRVTEKGKAP